MHAAVLKQITRLVEKKGSSGIATSAVCSLSSHDCLELARQAQTAPMRFSRRQLAALLLLAVTVLYFASQDDYSRQSSGDGDQENVDSAAEPANGPPQWWDDLTLHTTAAGGAFRFHERAYSASLEADASYKRNTEVAIATQCSIESSYYLVETAERYAGPVSAAVLVTGRIGLAHAYINRLRECSPAVRSHVTFHLVYVNDYSSYTDNKAVWPNHVYEAMLQGRGSNAFGGDACSVITSGAARDLFTAHRNYAMDLPYPNNMLRNAARSLADRPYTFIVDIDMVPSPSLWMVSVSDCILGNFMMVEPQDFKDAIKSRAGHDSEVAYVVPAFEMQDSETMPRSKAELVAAWDRGAIRVSLPR